MEFRRGSQSKNIDLRNFWPDIRNSVNWRVGVGEAAGNGRLEGQIVARANEKGLEAFSQCRFGPKSEGAASERKQILVISERETGGGQEDGS
jgi:hypothetical protein